jgi:NADH-quinone oxidoreductase subunit G
VATIIVDGREYEVDPTKNLLETCLSLGLNLPYFCWHPALHSVGACRQCAVKQFKDENDTKGRIVMACMTPAADGTRISIDDPEAVDFRSSIIELLMTNHPHDCPVCDEGGECHLQDMTVMTGHDYRRYRFNKRTHLNQYLGPFVNHEMNRCIQCYRCVRFYRDFAGGRDFDVFAAHNNVYFGRQADGVLESEFSGNLVEVCPTGVFTDKTLKKHFTRKWDLTTAPSICVGCGVGCNTIAGERYGEVRRIRNRYNGQVNGYFLCDRGRYGYEFVNHARRIRRPLYRSSPEAGQEIIGVAEALGQLSAMLQSSNGVIGLGSPRASLESNFALRSLVGPERFFSGISDPQARLIGQGLDVLRRGPARSPSLRQIGEADAVLVLGEDVTNTAPLLALQLRQAARVRVLPLAGELKIDAWNDAAVREALQSDHGPFYVATPAAGKIDDLANGMFRGSPQEIAALGQAVAHAIDRNVPAVADLDSDTQRLAQEIAKALSGAIRPLIVSGSSLASAAVVEAAANIAWALCRTGTTADLSLVVPEANSLGLAMMGGAGLESALEALQSEPGQTLIVLEGDLPARAGSALSKALFEAAGQVVVLDSLESPTTLQADLVLPAATFAEGDGTLVNFEGRAQRYYQVFVPQGDVMESWRWLVKASAQAGLGLFEQAADVDQVISEMARALPELSRTAELAPPHGFRIVGMKIPRQAHRFSGRTAMLANINVSEPKPPDDPDTPFSFSMEGYKGMPPAQLVGRYWAPGWNSVQSLNKFQAEVGGPLRGGDPGARLIEPEANSSEPYFDAAGAAPSRPAGKWLTVPLYHLFGSEPLSLHSPGIAELSPAPYIGLSVEDAAALGLSEGDRLKVEIEGVGVELMWRSVPGLPGGLAGVPQGMTEAALPGIDQEIRLKPAAGGAP